MRRRYHRLSTRHLLESAVAIGLAGLAAAPAPAATCSPRVESLILTLGGAPSRAEILRPPVGAARGVMVLIHGSDVADLDNSIVDSAGTIVSTPLRDVARAMACGGIATIRYDKRFVTGPDKVDRAKFEKATLDDFLADTATALDAAKARPDLRALPEFVYGWSEGTAVAAALAVRRPQVRGAIFQAPVIVSFARSLQRDYPRVGAPYMLHYATGGAVDAAAIARAAAGPAGVITRVYLHMFQGFAPGEKLNPLLDANHDGRIDIAREATPVITGWFADGVGGGLSIYASAVALPGIRAQLPKFAGESLIVQGEADGAMDDADARALQGERLPKVTVKLYPGLGHTLGPSPSPIEDRFLPIAAAPLHDMVEWAVARTRHSRIVPRRLL